MVDAVDVVVERADALLGFGRPDEARTVLTAAVADAPDDVRLWASLARAERARHDHASSRVAAERALAIDPEHAGAMWTRINALLETKERVEAKRAADRLLECSPDWAQAHLLWAFAYTRWSRAKRTITEEQIWPLADVPRAAAALDRALELAPHDAVLLADAAGCYRALAWTDETYRARATAALDRALELDPNDEWVMLAAGSVLSAPGRVANAAQVLAQHPRSWEALRRVDHGVWNLVSIPVAVVTWLLLASVLGAHVAAGGGANVVTKTLGWGVTGVGALWVLVVEVGSFVAFPRGLLRRTVRRIPLVPVVLVLTAVTWIVGTVVAVVLLTGTVPPDGDAAAALVAVLAVALLLESAARSAITIALRRTQVRSGLWAGPVAERGRRREDDSDRTGALLGGLAALAAWLHVALSAPSVATWAAWSVPLLLAARVFVFRYSAELLRADDGRRRPRAVVDAVLAGVFATGAVGAVGLQVATALGVV
ncbi:tetratricopeptide repeat protein [Curtobacterium poinsettiae]|uniref:tetratricopeptide repeat protein n=1 Tax=Curtobacterium poinsettiae TaxID=159612 RepID=UPI0021C7849F|nr:tetratricopeptide repeat protein [Curtobacterium flaccumfaciens]MCU0154085.1 tetratricopeptide repeat protein [Curtobacterium flaccumfaciens pv. poinsettiae]UXN14017.1 tetratricopeptide repeat protein [Curtobacterium flaccumfaciens pv. poinsettiae]